ncbi:MAG: Holliday junction resolvase RuvX [Chloroherpetonaceae bacterium]|nr:Holliday junction resolvase RuvX [Chloroherpetonaceae bacterium]
MKKRIIAIDYGTKRIGLATTDLLGLFATPVGTFNENDLWKELDKLNQDGGIDLILLGYPFNGDGTKNKVTILVEKFESRLSEHCVGLPVRRIPEHSSTKEANEFLIQMGYSPEKRKKESGKLDQTVAALMLQRYLNYGK